MDIRQTLIAQDSEHLTWDNYVQPNPGLKLAVGQALVLQILNLPSMQGTHIYLINGPEYMDSIEQILVKNWNASPDLFLHRSK